MCCELGASSGDLLTFMFASIGYFDLPLLLGAGFSFGIADTVLWGKDKTGQEWHAVVESDNFITFAPRLPSGATGQATRMRRDDFHEKFL